MTGSLIHKVGRLNTNIGHRTDTRDRGTVPPKLGHVRHPDY